MLVASAPSRIEKTTTSKWGWSDRWMMVCMRMVSFLWYMKDGDISKFSTSHRMSSQRILKTHGFHPYNFFMKKWWFQKNQFRSTTLATYDSLHLEESTSIPIYLSIFFPTSILIQWNSPYSQVPGVKGGIDFTTFFSFSFSLLFVSSLFLKKLNSLRI